MNSRSSDIAYQKIDKIFPYKIKKNFQLKYLLIIRAAEIAFIELSKLKKIRGPLHTSVGQEAVAVSVCTNLKKQDAIFSNHRGHGHYIAKGGNISKLVLELLGKPSGCCGGFGGSMHIAELKKNIIGSNGIVGGGVPIACGFAYSSLLSKKNNITAAFFGDGAMNQGVVLESLNIAAIYDLPILLVCENNFYAYSTKSKDMTKTDLYIRAKGFGIESYKLDGMSFTKSNNKIKSIIKKIRKKKKPIFVEFETYRYHRHFASEMQRKIDYIDLSVQKKMIKRDPCYSELKKFGFIMNDTDEILRKIKETIISFGLQWSKK